MLIQRHAQIQDRKGESDVNAAFGNDVHLQDLHGLEDMVHGHAECKDDRHLAEQGLLALFQLLRRCQIGVQGIDVDLLDGFFFFAHRLSPILAVFRSGISPKTLE